MVVTSTAPLTIHTSPDFAQSSGLGASSSNYLILDNTSGVARLDLRCETAGEGVLKVQIITEDPATGKSTVHLSKTFTYKCIPSAAGLKSFQLNIEPHSGGQLVGIPFNVKITWEVPPVWLPRKPALIQQFVGALRAVEQAGFLRQAGVELLEDPISAKQDTVDREVQCIEPGEGKIIVLVRSPDTGLELALAVATFRCEAVKSGSEDGEAKDGAALKPTGDSELLTPRFVEGKETVLATYRKITGSCIDTDYDIPYPDEFTVATIIEVRDEGLLNIFYLLSRLIVASGLIDPSNLRVEASESHPIQETYSLTIDPETGVWEGINTYTDYEGCYSEWNFSAQLKSAIGTVKMQDGSLPAESTWPEPAMPRPAFTPKEPGTGSGDSFSLLDLRFPRCQPSSFQQFTKPVDFRTPVIIEYEELPLGGYVVSWIRKDTGSQGVTAEGTGIFNEGTTSDAIDELWFNTISTDATRTIVIEFSGQLEISSGKLFGEYEEKGLVRDKVICTNTWQIGEGNASN